MLAEIINGAGATSGAGAAVIIAVIHKAVWNGMSRKDVERMVLLEERMEQQTKAITALTEEVHSWRNGG